MSWLLSVACGTRCSDELGCDYNDGIKLFSVNRKVTKLD